MQAKITKKHGYNCAPEGHTTETFSEGSTVTGKVAEWAVADGAAEKVYDPREETKVTPPDETKVNPKRGPGRPRKSS